jgi:hypothetical protein
VSPILLALPVYAAMQAQPQRMVIDVGFKEVLFVVVGEIIAKQVFEKSACYIAEKAGISWSDGPTIERRYPSAVEKGEKTVIGVATPGKPGALLTLTNAGTRVGKISLSSSNEVIYEAAANVTASEFDTFAYSIEDKESCLVVSGTANVQLDAGPSIAAQTPSVVDEKTRTTIIAMVTPGLAGDTLTLAQAPGSLGTLSLGTAQANGNQPVIYTAPAKVSMSAVDKVTYTVADQHNDVVVSGTASVQLDTGPSIAAQTPSVGDEKTRTTVMPSLAGDTLTLAQAAGSLGTLSLGAAQPSDIQQAAAKPKRLVLVLRHSDYDWLILSQSRMGKSSGGTRIWMLLATPG